MSEICVGANSSTTQVALVSVTVHLQVPFFITSASFSRGFFMSEICVGANSSTTQVALVSVTVHLRVPLFITSASFSRGFLCLKFSR